MQHNTDDAMHAMGRGFAASVELAEKYRDLQPGASMSLLVDRPLQPTPAPLGYDRLPLPWYQSRTESLKAKVQAKNIDALLLHSSVNQIYFSGCFRGRDSRNSWVLFPADQANVANWFSPLLDRDLIQSWWCTNNTSYFCEPHAAGGFPNEGRLASGSRVDLFVWLLENLRAQGHSTSTIGTDMRLCAEEREKIHAVLPDARFVSIADECLAMRIRKTPEEIALTQRVYRYFDTLHAFARDYVLTRGTSATDFEIGLALRSFGINLLMQDIRHDGKPHSAVGIDVTAHYVRSGRSTAYPHPNQFFFNRIKKGEPLYVNTDMQMGGYGGECYRNYQFLPVSPQQEKIWQTVADSVDIMVDGCRPGRTCGDLALDVHRFQVRQGLRHLIYHRPGHGVGQNYEGHQAPFLSLGDETVIEENMMFSVEPGLYDEPNGIGVNPSDTLLVTSAGGVLMSRVPISREWSFLEL